MELLLYWATVDHLPSILTLLLPHRKIEAK